MRVTVESTTSNYLHVLLVSNVRKFLNKLPIQSTGAPSIESVQLTMSFLTLSMIFATARLTWFRLRSFKSFVSDTGSCSRQQDKGRPLPKFGEWDVNNPSSAEGFTVIFNKARNDKKSSAAGGGVVIPEPLPVENTFLQNDTPKRRWFCCG